MPLPNFFIIGAPKSGTTALYHCLRQHPDIFMPVVKEPHYFLFAGAVPEVFDVPGGTLFSRVAVWRPEDYMMLFASASQSAIGEASMGYIRSPEAARRIQENLPSSRIIAVLRHPVDRAYSSYRFMVQQGIEPAKTFADALADESGRIERRWFSGLYHKTNGLYFQQLRVYYDLFPRNQIKIFLYEDWNKTPAAMLKDLFGFLNVDPDFVPQVHRDNVSLVPRYRKLYNLAKHPEIIDRKLGRTPAVLRRACHSLARRIDKAYNRVKPLPLDPALRRSLTDEYRDDIMQLQGLIDRDLSHWLTSNE